MTGTVVANSVTSFLIPANTIAPETQYRAILDYSSRVNTIDAGFIDGDAGVTFDLVTDLYFKTNPFLPGDYNRNGFVDAADFTVWRDSLGRIDVASFSGADGDGDGKILSSDYNFWKQQFGMSGAGAGLGSTVGVAEPNSFALAAICALATFAANVVKVPARPL